MDELQNKLGEFRKEKRSWTNEAVALRGQVKDAQVCFLYMVHYGALFADEFLTNELGNCALRHSWQREKNCLTILDLREFKFSLFR